MCRSKSVLLLGWLAFTLGATACARTDGDDDDGVHAADGNGNVGQDSNGPGTTVNPNAGGNVSVAPVVDGRIAVGIDPYACLDMPPDPNGLPATAVYLNHCNQTLSQRVLHNANNQLTNALGTACLTVAGGNAPYAVSLAPCRADDALQRWAFEAGRWRTGDGNVCLQLDDGQTNDLVALQAAACDPAADTQSWTYVAPFSAAVVDPLAAQTTVAGRCAAHVYVSAAALDANTAAALAAAEPDLQGAVRAAMLQDCNLLFAEAVEVPSNRAALRVVLTAGTTDTVYAANGKDIGMPAGYLVQQHAAGSPNLALGLLNQTIASYYVPANPNEAPWVRQGLWWYARIRSAGYPTTAKVKTGGYAAGGASAGFFFDWMDHAHPGVVLAMVTQMQLSQGPITDAFFQQQTGQSLATLWTAYTASF